jgi:hypothetical protein
MNQFFDDGSRNVCQLAILKIYDVFQIPHYALNIIVVNYLNWKQKKGIVVINYNLNLKPVFR